MTIEKLIKITASKPVTDELFDEFILAIEDQELAFGGGYDNDQEGLEIDGSIYLHDKEDTSPMQAVCKALGTLDWIASVEIRDFTAAELK